jgi:PadR family transcriptional regulator PadR
MRRTKRLVEVAAALLADPDGKHWGYELSKASGVRSGVLYPMLTRLLDEGWLTDGWEDTATLSGRPPRRYYQLTDEGKLQLGAIVRAAQSHASTSRLGWGYA